MIPGLMAAAAVLAGAALAIVLGPDGRGAVLAGSAGPLAAAVATWVIVERVHRRAPVQVAPAMIKLFAAKVVFFGVYVIAVVMLLPVPAKAFIVSFTSQYIMLHFLEAMCLRRLFAEGARRSGLD